MNVFISYRRSVSPSAARQIAEALKAHLGPEQVFFDVVDIESGAQWRDELLRSVRGADVVLAVIGPRWGDAARDRDRAQQLAPAEEDVLLLEIENAMRFVPLVIPVLVEGATMPAPATLRRPLRALTRRQSHTLRHDAWDEDLAALIAKLDAHPAPQPVPRAEPSAEPPDGVDEVAARVGRYVLNGGLVTVLGPAFNAAEADGSGPADAMRLAAQIGDQFAVTLAEHGDLAWVSQHAALSDGRHVLCQTLRKLVEPESEPNSVHELLARLPRTLELRGEPRPQMILTTNYDSALERAFDRIAEPYDLAVFTCTGDARGRFVHRSWEGGGDAAECETIWVPNEYVGLPIDEEGELERTLIVKLLGGVADLGQPRTASRDNFVVTEDDFIAYLNQSAIEEVIPQQILGKIRDSHLLFLGYPLSDWSVRVFVQRLWGEERLDSDSYAINGDVSRAERKWWGQLGVEAENRPVARFARDLERALAA